LEEKMKKVVKIDVSLSQYDVIGVGKRFDYVVAINGCSVAMYSNIKSARTLQTAIKKRLGGIETDSIPSRNNKVGCVLGKSVSPRSSKADLIALENGEFDFFKTKKFPESEYVWVQE
jgi:hypothetical protein